MMNFRQLAKLQNSRAGILLVVAGVCGILLIFSLFFCCSRDGNTAGGDAETSALSHEEQAPEPESGPRGDEDFLPDLAEAVARFSRLMVQTDPDSGAFVEDSWRWTFGEAGIPERFARNIAASGIENPAFIMELLVILQQDPYTYFLVDKQHPLPGGYEPDDLIPIRAGTVRLGRDGLTLRRMAENALQEMAAAAAAEGVFFTAGSAYRSAEYQAQVYEREVKIYGKETADRESAQPGKSQHQLGLVVDFVPIDDAFAKTPASAWLLRNAARFGWSLSFPDGYEEITGYRWESWHYRYVGPELAAFINNYFEGIQQYALQFINVWQRQTGGQIDSE